LKPLGDPEYQQRVWVEQRGPEVNDYDDATVYFLENCEEIFESPSNYEGIDNTVQSSLKILYNKVNKFDEEIADYIPRNKCNEIINHPEWLEIQKLANETYNLIINSLKERNYDYT
jgi:hypothetical protein